MARFKRRSKSSSVEEIRQEWLKLLLDQYITYMRSAANLLFLMSDEHARSAIGAYGHPVVKTPTLDWLATHGSCFTQAYTPSPICISARASLATGLPVFEHGCWSSAQPYHGQVESWMHRLRGHGHTVVSIGKLHFRSGQDDNGFSEELLPMYLANEGRGWPQGLVRNPMPEFKEAWELAAEIGSGETSYTEYDRRIATEACRWLKRYPSTIRDKPWVLFISFVSPHYPFIAPAPFFDSYEGLDIPPAFASAEKDAPRHPVLRQMASFWNYDDYFNENTRKIARRAYLGLCSFLDDNIRRVLKALEDSGQANNTVIIYTSDHGEMLGNHGFWAKSVMFEDAVAVPMFLTGPGIPVSVNNTPVSLSDLAATAAVVVGQSPSPTTASWQSRPVQSFIDESETERVILSEYHDGGSPTGLFMIRQGRWKYIYYAGAYPSQLFDLAKDPQELEDLGTHPVWDDTRALLHASLCDILDPEEVNDMAFAAQMHLLQKLGGADKVLEMAGFNHTPVQNH